MGSILTTSEYATVFCLLAVSGREADFAGVRLRLHGALQDSLRVTKQGLEVHVFVSHREIIRTFFPVTLMVQQWWEPADISSWKIWLKNAAFLLTLTAP